VLGFLGIVFPQLALNLLSTLHGVHHGGKIHQEGIPHNLDDMPMMFSYSVLDELIMHLQQPQHARFIGTHLAAKADDIGEHNCRELTGFGLKHSDHR
jgi:hypothetical protein